MSEYKAVPVEPTAEMMATGGIEMGARDEDARMVWKAMIAAAPAVQGEPVSEDSVDSDADWVQGPYVANTMGRGWCVRIDGTNIFDGLNEHGVKGRITLQIAADLKSREEAEAVLRKWCEESAPQPAEQQPDVQDYVMVPAKEFESVLNRADWRTAKNRAELRHMLKAMQSSAAPDVAGLVEALTMARETIASALRANAPDYFTTDADIARHVVIQRIDAAIQEVSHDNQ